MHPQVNMTITLTFPVPDAVVAAQIATKVEFAIRDIDLTDLTATIETVFTDRREFDTLSL